MLLTLALGNIRRGKKRLAQCQDNVTEWGYQVMVQAACCPCEVVLYSRHECTLSQLSTRPDMTLDVARSQNNNKQQTKQTLSRQPP